MPSVDIPSTEPSGRYLPMTAVVEVDDVEDLPDADDAGQYLYVEEFDATYRWDAASEDEIDNIRVLGVEDETGRWLLNGNEISLRPFGGVANDWERLMLVVTAMAYFGKAKASGEAWRCSTEEVTPSGAFIEFMPGATVACSLTPNAPGTSLAACPFYNSSGTAGHGGVSVPTLSADADAGSKTITISESVPAGNEIAVGDWTSIEIDNADATGRMTRRVVARVGNVLTLDRPLTRNAKIGDECLGIGFDPVRDVRIIGNGVTFTGTGDQVVEFLSPVDCHVSGIRVSGEFEGVAALTMDLGHRESGFADCDVDGEDVIPGGFGIIGGENGWLDRCNSRGTAAWAVGLLSSFNPRVSGGIHSGGAASPIGLYVGVDGPGAIGGTRSALVEGVALLGFDSGVQVQDGSRAIRFVNVEASDCDHGFHLGLGATGDASTDITIAGGIASRNGAAIFAEGTGIHVVADGLAIEGCTSNSVVASGGARVDLAAVSLAASDAHAGLEGLLYATGAGSLITIDGVTAVCTQAGAGNSAQLIQCENAGAVRSAGRRSACAFGGAGLDYVTGVYLGTGCDADIANFAISGTGGSLGTYGINAAHATAEARLGPSVDLSLAAVNDRLVGAGQFRFPMPTLQTFADNAAAVTGGLSVGDMYKTAGGVVLVVV